MNNTRSTLPAPDAQPYAPSGQAAPPAVEPAAPIQEAAASNDPGMPAMTMPQPHGAEAPTEAPIDYSKPVAYDQQGRPLYAHPPDSPQAQAAPVQPAPGAPAPAAKPQPQDKPVKTEKPDDDVAHGEHPAPVGSQEADQRHAEALVKYPDLNLSEGEYVISAVPRDPIGLLEIWGAAIIFFIAVGGFVAAFMYEQDVSQQTRTVTAFGLALLGLLDVIGASLFSKIYQGNKLFVTNESIIQQSQTSLVAKREQTVSLGNIQNVKYVSGGYLASLFDFGTIQLSTEGEDTDYRFPHVASPKKQAAIITNAVEAFNNSSGRHHH